jgi:biotin synthase
MNLDPGSIECWLREKDPAALEKLWQEADRTRKTHVGDEVHLRGLIEISNHCARRCGYCGLNASNLSLTRYRMDREEILECAAKAVRLGYGTVVLQAGEDYGIAADWMAQVVHSIKEATGLAVTLSLGERTLEELKAWKLAGADRYLLRFETSDVELYHRIHPPLPMRTSNRPDILRELRELGYEIGSGIMIGIPGQSFASLARDIDLFRGMDLDMIGVGPYIAHPQTELAKHAENFAPAGADQVPNTEAMTYKVIALTRLVCPNANIPSTTALATLNKENGRELGLQRGANIVMPNLTPPKYRICYEIYPDKACLTETAEACGTCLNLRIAAIGRTVGKGPGGRKSASRNI